LAPGAGVVSKWRNKILCWNLKWNTNALATDNFLYIEWKMAQMIQTRWRGGNKMQRNLWVNFVSLIFLLGFYWPWQGGGHTNIVTKQKEKPNEKFGFLTTVKNRVGTL
jgi:hypothetical protein